MNRRVPALTARVRLAGLLFSALLTGLALAAAPAKVLSPRVVRAAARTLLPQPASPVLVIKNSAYGANPFGGYLAEILRAEGIVEFQQVELTALMADPNRLGFLAAFNVVLLAETPLDSAGEQLFRDYVSGGGKLISMRPDRDLAGLFGLTFVGARQEQSLQYFAFDVSKEPGSGIVGTSLQYHGQADNYGLSGATPLGQLWDDPSTPTSYPAVSLNAYGAGRAAAFSFDLARSIVLMRQGNPAWKNTEGDNLFGYRPTDMFVRPGGEKWLSPQHTRIPQADEQQRFLVNLIAGMADLPLPRMWYLPDKRKAIIINTGDGEDLGGQQLARTINDAASYGGAFTTYLRNDDDGGGPKGVENTTAAEEAAWRAAGHEFGPHVYGNGADGAGAFAALRSAYASIVGDIQTKFGHGSLTARSHTIDWTGWSDMAAIEAEFGARLDTNYYHYVTWLCSNSANCAENYNDHSNGYFTGSGLPQKFADEAGNVLPIYQALTEWPDEWFDDRQFGAARTARIVREMLTSAENGYYSAFVNNIHHVRYNILGQPDITYLWANEMWAYARSRGIPMWSAEMLLDFVETRDGSRFNNITWNGSTLAFDFSAPRPGRALTLMVPARAAGGSIQSLTAAGSPVAYTTEVIKGREYAMFTTTSQSARVVASYTPDFFDDFDGGQLNPASWQVRSFGGGAASASVANGVVTVDPNSHIRTAQTWSRKTLEGLVTLNDGPNSHFGWATTLNSGDDGIADPHWMIFTVSNGQVFARTRLNDGQAGPGGEINTGLSGVQIGVPHRFKIVWGDNNSIEFWVDGSLKAVHNRAFNEQMRVYLSAYVQPSTAEWVNVSSAPAQPVALFDHFVGSQLDSARWTAGNWFGSAINVGLANGWVNPANYTYIRSNQRWTHKALEGLVTLRESGNTHFGFATTIQSGDQGIVDPHWMIFTVSNGQVFARTRLDDGQGEINTPLEGVRIGVPHLWRVVWRNNGAIEFWVDGVLKASHTRPFTEQMRVYLSSNAGQTASAEWVRVSEP